MQSLRRVAVFLFLSLSVNAQEVPETEGEIYQRHITECWRYGEDDWYDYNVYVSYDQTFRRNGHFTHVTLTVIPKPTGGRRYVTCTIKDGEEPRLSKRQMDERMEGRM